MLYFGYLVASLVTAIVPRTLAYWLADLVGDIWYAASPSLRRNLDHNLALIPSLAQDQARRRKVAHKAVRNFAEAVADFLYLPRTNLKNLRAYVDIESFERIREALGGRPAIVVTAHLGNWELAAAAAAMLGIDLHVIVYDHPDRRIAAIFRKRREAKGLKVLSVRSTARNLSSVLDTSSLGIAADRDFTGQGMPARFFGALTNVPSAYAGLAVSKGVPVIPVFCLRQEDGKYRLDSEQPILARPADGPGTEAIVAECLRAFEKYVEKYPEQWYRFDKIGE